MDQQEEALNSDRPDSGTFSFVIKIWVEETAGEAGQALWRGHITHIPSGRRRYFQDLHGMSAAGDPSPSRSDTALCEGAVRPGFLLDLVTGAAPVWQ